MSALEDVVSNVAGTLAKAAGASEPVATLIGDGFEDLVQWAERAAAGRPGVTLKDLLNSADVAAKALEDAELG